PALIAAFISAEDKNFFEHKGLDYMGIMRAAMRTGLNKIRGSGGMQGGSTITQQVAKNMLLSSEQTIIRKIREAFVAQRIEKTFTKAQILELYMNEIYLGGRSYGVGAASLNYFGKSLSDLSLAECALLAALPKAPGKVNPYLRPDAAQGRRDWVLGRMAANGYISEEEAAIAIEQPLTTVERLRGEVIEASAYFVEEVRRDVLELYDAVGGGEQAFYEGGLSIRSTLDTKMQLAAQNSLQAGLESYDRRKGWRGEIGRLPVSDNWAEALMEFEAPAVANGNKWLKALVLSTSSGAATVGLETGERVSLAPEDVRWADARDRAEGGAGLSAGDVVLVTQAPPPDVMSRTIMEVVETPDGAPYHLRQIPEVEGALVAMDPHTGRVLAMAGGYSFRRSQFNRAVQAERQPGSSFKPIVYAAALDSGFTPASKILDAPFVINTPQGLYKPSNYTDKFYGPSTLRLGIEKSRNLMTVRLAQQIGMEIVSDYGGRFGLYDQLPPFLSMSLGAGETTPMQMAAAYAILVNGGKSIEPTLLDRIQDRYGRTVFRRDERPCEMCLDGWADQLPPELEDTREQVIDAVTAYQSVSMMEGVVERGTATRVRAVGKPLAGKTGTTNDYVDAWFVGFSPDLVAAIWIGHDTPKTLGDGESGGRVASPVFRDFMMLALEDAPNAPFRIPPGVRLVEIDAKSGELPDASSGVTILEAFKPGSEPTRGGEAGDWLDFLNQGEDAPQPSAPIASAPTSEGFEAAGVVPGQIPAEGVASPAPKEFSLDDGVY
ncbi:MAG: PBP1A family penicillin-binding protein, partial [Pseudomonadota bacterium]